MQLRPNELQQYSENGFLIVEDIFTSEELQPLIDSIDARVDALANKLFHEKKIGELYANEGFLTRLTSLERAFPGAATLIHTGGVLPDSFAALWSSDKLLDIMEQILGTEIAGHPVWNLRAKTPLNPLATVPWHQDTAYLAEGSERTLQPTAWIPLVDADEKNGCMQVIRGGHKTATVFPHKLENTRGHADSWYLYIDEADLPRGEVVTCMVKKGSMLLLNNLIPHRSTENYSDTIRWSIDLRWQRPNELSGMEGIKDPILMRSSADPQYRPDWAGWAKVSRQVGLHDVLVDENHEIRPEDARVRGPWMDRWSKK